MKKLIKILLTTLLVLSLIITSICFFVGNYVYDLTLNPYSTHNILDAIGYGNKMPQENYNWLSNHSEDIYIQSFDGLSLHGYSMTQNENHRYMIMVHGYRGDGATILSQVRHMYEKDYNLLVPDLRGHGKSEGNSYGMGWLDRKDIMSWIDFIVSKDPKCEIVLYGVSMGAATIMCATGETLPSQVKCAIEDCGYTSVWEVFKNQLDINASKLNVNSYSGDLMLLMSSILIKERAGYYIQDASPLNMVKKSHTPTLFIHGDQDDFVPFSMLDELYNAASCKKEKLVIKGANHANSCFKDTDTYYQAIDAFLDQYVK